MHLLDKVREMKQFIIDESNGLSAEELNRLKLDPNKTGYKWLDRWRRWYNISKRHAWNKLKVSWEKIKKRCKVLLTNIFRLMTA